MNDDVTVLEYGGRWVKGGLALNYPSDEEPRVLTPSAVTIEQSSSPGYDSEAAALAAGATVHRPVRGGKIVSWDQFEALVHYMLYELLGWELGKEGNVLMCEPVLTSRTDRETMSQLMFEAFNVSGLFIQDQAVLSLYAFGRTHGLVVDVGHDKVDVSTVIEGLVNQSSVRRLNYGGADLTRYLQKLMADKPPTQAQPQEQQPRPDSMQVDGEQQQGAPQQEQQQEEQHQQQPSRPLTAEGAMEALKELCARCCESERALRGRLRRGAQQPQSFTLPDGQRFSVGDEGLRVAEALFHPHTLLGVLSPNLVEAALDSASVVPELLMRKVLYENMVVVGGGAVMPGLQQRFLTHMRALVPPSALSSAAVCAVPEYLPDPHLVRHASWMGGGVLAQVALAQGHFLTKADYDEAGPGCVHRRCTPKAGAAVRRPLRRWPPVQPLRRSAGRPTTQADAALGCWPGAAPWRAAASLQHAARPRNDHRPSAAPVSPSIFLLTVQSNGPQQRPGAPFQVGACAARTESFPAESPCATGKGATSRCCQGVVPRAAPRDLALGRRPLLCCPAAHGHVPHALSPVGTRTSKATGLVAALPSIRQPASGSLSQLRCSAPRTAAPPCCLPGPDHHHCPANAAPTRNAEEAAALGSLAPRGAAAADMPRAARRWTHGQGGPPGAVTPASPSARLAVGLAGRPPSLRPCAGAYPWTQSGGRRRDATPT